MLTLSIHCLNHSKFKKIFLIDSVQFSSVAQACPTLCDPMNRSTPGLPVHHQLQVHPNPCPLSRWYRPTISSSVVPFSSHLQSLPAEPQGKPNVHHRYLVQFSCSVVSDSLRPQRLQHARLPVHHQLKLMSIMLMMPSNHLILSRPLLLPPSVFPSIRVFSSELVLHIRWPRY